MAADTEDAVFASVVDPPFCQDNRGPYDRNIEPKLVDGRAAIKGIRGRRAMSRPSMLDTRPPRLMGQPSGSLEGQSGAWRAQPLRSRSAVARLKANSRGGNPFAGEDPGEDQLLSQVSENEVRYVDRMAVQGTDASL